MRVWETVLNLLFPPRCGACRALIDWDAPYSLCESCRNGLCFLADGFHCAVCGRPLSHDWGTCEECRTTKRYFSLHLSCCLYEDAIRNMILHFKFPPYLRELAQPLGQLLIKRMEAYDSFPVPNLVTCVPLSEQKLKERGYNQSALLAHEIAQHFDWPEDDSAICKIKETQTQSKLSRAQRQENVRGAYGIANRDVIAGKRVLLVDDVYTTGATVSEIARMLRRNGAYEVIVATVAITERQAD